MCDRPVTTHGDGGALGDAKLECKTFPGGIIQKKKQNANNITTKIIARDVIDVAL